MSPIVISHMVQQQAGIEAICHMACRDRNMVGLQSELLGAWSLGVRSVLAVTGDPAQIGDYPYATSVYDIDSIGLIRALARMNEGEDLMSNAIGEPTGFCISCACNPVADDLDREIRRLERKAAEGAHVAFSQPIFDVRSLEVFREKTAHIPIRFMVGVIPLRSLRHAEFLHYEVPGMTIPKWTRDRMATVADSAADSATVGIELAVEFLEKAKAMSDGVYLMPPFKKYSMAIDILSALSLLPDATVESSC
jgi:homocysteine S-methyltransferase